MIVSTWSGHRSSARVRRYAVRARLGAELHQSEQWMLNLGGHDGLYAVATSKDVGRPGR